MATRAASMPRSRAARAKAPRAKAPTRATKAPRKQEGDFVALARDALRRREPDAVPDALLQEVLAAALKVYAAKIERHGGEMKPYQDGAVTATESVVAACALIRAADLNLFDVAMWFNRPPAMS
jgi:hypothetical protein